ncbi:MAG: hypothetical protein KGJ70_00075 [Gemmatimonadota bacterium]|nr:hypothetical protein [Gemmatimonadota bacterium]
MSSLGRWWLAGAAAAILIGAPRAARAQTQAEYRARVRALVPVWHEVAALKRREDSLAALTLPSDTVRSGPLVLLADSALVGFARRVAPPAAAALDRRFGHAAEILRSRPYLLSRPDSAGSPDSPISLSEVDGTGQARYVQSEPPDVNAMVWAVTHRAAAAIGASLGGNFAHWLGGDFPADTATPAMWTGVRIDLVTSPFAMARACYAGADSACALALGVAGTDDPVARWFDASERRDRVRHLTYQYRADHAGLYNACVMLGADTACAALLRLMPTADVDPPLGASARQSLLTLALDLGGPDAVTRMEAAPDDRGAQLAAAGGIPVDSLVRVWRHDVVAARSSNPSMSWGMALTSLLWVAACGALALRSSPWR